MKDKLVVIFVNNENGDEVDLEIPLYITADELIKALNYSMQLNIDMENIEKCFLRTENPIGILRGDRLLADFHIHTGTKICYEKH